MDTVPSRLTIRKSFSRKFAKERLLMKVTSVKEPRRSFQDYFLLFQKTALAPKKSLSVTGSKARNHDFIFFSGNFSKIITDKRNSGSFVFHFKSLPGSFKLLL